MQPSRANKGAMPSQRGMGDRARQDVVPLGMQTVARAECCRVSYSFLCCRLWLSIPSGHQQFARVSPSAWVGWTPLQMCVLLLGQYREDRDASVQLLTLNMCSLR